MPTTAQVRLKLPDGSDYGFTGTVEFSEVIVDQSTGTVTLRARFPNPQSILLPGMFVNAAVRAGDRHLGLPRAAASDYRAIRRAMRPCSSSGRAIARCSARSVADTDAGPNWVVTQGLAPGEKVITQGTANLKDGAPDQAGPGDARRSGSRRPPPGRIEGDASEARRLAACRGSSSIARSSPG